MAVPGACVQNPLLFPSGLSVIAAVQPPWQGRFAYTLLSIIGGRPQNWLINAWAPCLLPWADSSACRHLCLLCLFGAERARRGCFQMYRHWPAYCKSSGKGHQARGRRRRFIFSAAANTRSCLCKQACLADFLPH